ncbi:MAG: sortase [Patescibacteria group bacterium]|nr:sortase [Patescibacteria group bacterium]
MKKLSNILVIIVFALVGVLLGLRFIPQARQVNQSQSTVPVVSTSVPQPVQDQNKPEPAVKAVEVKPAAEPQTLSIPKLGVNAAVESVGQDRSGRMDVPTGVDNVGWYSLGYKPGEKGNAVIDGHLDAVTGAPAVFYYLDRLQPGDQVIVTDKNGKDLTFEVTVSQSYPFDQVPLQEIFGSNDKSRLNLITCTGVWNSGARNYSNRLVVYAELKS